LCCMLELQVHAGACANYPQILAEIATEYAASIVRPSTC